MSLISRVRKQKAIRFEQGGINLMGKRVFHEPVEFDCRWQDVSEEFIDAQGSRTVSNALVFCDREMLVGDVLVLATLEDPINAFDPLENDKAYPIRKFEAVPNLRNTETLYLAYL